jgi:hypothetical protein
MSSGVLQVSLDAPASQLVKKGATTDSIRALLHEQRKGCSQLRASELFKEFAVKGKRTAPPQASCRPFSTRRAWAHSRRLATRLPACSRLRPLSATHPHLFPDSSPTCLQDAPVIDDLDGEAQGRMFQVIQKAASEGSKQSAGVWSNPHKPYTCSGEPSLVGVASPMARRTFLAQFAALALLVCRCTCLQARPALCCCLTGERRVHDLQHINDELPRLNRDELGSAKHSRGKKKERTNSGNAMLARYNSRRPRSPGAGGERGATPPTGADWGGQHGPPSKQLAGKLLRHKTWMKVGCRHATGGYSTQHPASKVLKQAGAADASAAAGFLKSPLQQQRSKPAAADMCAGVILSSHSNTSLPELSLKLKSS